MIKRVINWWIVYSNTNCPLTEFVFCLGMMSTTASLGLILLWDVDAGLTQIDKYLYSTEDYIKVSDKLYGMAQF